MSMKAYVLENGFEQDIPSSLIKYLVRHEIDCEWYDMRQRFWPEKTKATFKFFSGLPTGTEFYIHTVFDGFAQLDLMVELLHKLQNKRFSIHIMNPSLCENFVDFYEQYNSEITPDTDEYNDSADLREQFKADINTKFEQVLTYHKLIQLSWAGNTQFKTYKQIKDQYDEQGY